jgi:hypothetical protein
MIISPLYDLLQAYTLLDENQKPIIDEEIATSLLVEHVMHNIEMKKNF